MKIGILGGTFDPIHLGHLQLAQNARTQFSLEKVFFVPAFQSPHKKAVPPVASSRDRLNMVRLATEGNAFLEVSDLEVKRGGISYAFDTLLEFEKKYPDASFFLILGKDAFEGLDSWHCAAEIKRKNRFLVADRSISGARTPEGVRVDWIQMPLCPISSSGIREAIKKVAKVDDYLSPKVLQYIHTNRLYRKS